MEKAIIYARQSFGKNDESVSIEIQIANCENWCKRNGVDVIGVYADRNTSSECYPDCESGRANAEVDRGYKVWKQDQRTKGRPEYKVGLGKAFDQIERDHPEYLVVYTGNRLGRSATNSNLNNFLSAFLMDHRCSIVDVQSNHITDFSDRIMLAFNTLKDALDYHSLVEKRKASMESVKKRIDGYKKYSTAYAVVMDKGDVTFDNEKAEVVKSVFEKIINGESYGAILDWLNMHCRNQRGRSKQWYLSTLKSIIANPVYAGYMLNSDGMIGRAVNIHDPIITYALWQRANEIMDARKANGTKAHIKGEEPRHWLPLSGYLMCPCGRRMLMFLDRGKIGYHCQNGKDHTTTLYVTDDTLLTLQKLFAVACIDGYRKAREWKQTGRKVDDLQSKLVKLQTAFRTKMQVVTDQDTYEAVKSDLDYLKEQISVTRQQLYVAQGMDATEQDAWLEQLDEDMRSLIDGRLLPQGTYMRLLGDTVESLVVADKGLDVKCRNGVAFTIPWVHGKHHSKRIMGIDLLIDADGETFADAVHVQLHITDDNEIEGGTVIYEDDMLTVVQH